MMRSISLLIVIVFSLNLNSQNLNQTQIDSLIEATKTTKDDTIKCSHYSVISNFYLYTNINQGLFYADKEIQLATKLNWIKGNGIGYLDKGKHLISKGDFYNAQNNLINAEAIFIKTFDDFNLAKAYNQLGILKANQNKFPEALNYFYMSIKVFEQIKNKPVKLSIANTYQNIANIYTATENYKKALENYDESIKIFQEIGNEELSIAMNIASKGLVYQKQNNHLAALKAFKEAEKIVLPLKSETNLAFINSWIGSAYLFLDNYDLSLQYSNKALNAIKSIGDEVLTAATIQNIGYAYLRKGFTLNNKAYLEEGVQNINKSLLINERIGNIELLINDYKYLSEYYEYKKDYKNSLETYKKYTLYNDSIYNTKSKQSIQNLQDERTIELKNREIKGNKLTLEIKEKQKWYFIAGLILLIIIGSLIFIQSRNRKKTNEKLRILNYELDQANKIKAQFFSILNHDLRAPISSLIHFLHLQKNHPELLDTESKTRLENKTISATENLLISMEDMLIWSKGQMEHFKPKYVSVSVKGLFKDIENHFLSTENVSIVFENTEDVELFTDIDYLKTIMRNLTSNAIKALSKSRDAKIIWKAWKNTNQTYLSITDNGSGGNQDQFKALYDDTEVVGIKTGLGLHLIRDLAKAIDCEITLDSKINHGATFILKINPPN